MEIKKTDAKGRISLGIPNRHFYVVVDGEGRFRLDPVPYIYEEKE